MQLHEAKPDLFIRAAGRQRPAESAARERNRLPAQSQGKSHAASERGGPKQPQLRRRRVWMRVGERGQGHHTSHLFTGFIGAPGAHLKAGAKAGWFWIGPTTRNWPGECGSVVIRSRACSGVVSEHQTWAWATKKSCSGVRLPSDGPGPPLRFSHAL